MKIALKKIILSVILLVLPATVLFGALSKTFAKPPKPAVQYRKLFGVPHEFKGNFYLPQNLIDQYNLSSTIPDTDTKALIKWKKDLYLLINKSYNNNDDRVRALCLFYVSEHGEFLENLSNMGVDSVINLDGKGSQNVSLFTYFDENAGIKTDNQNIGTIYGLIMAPRRSNLVKIFF